MMQFVDIQIVDPKKLFQYKNIILLLLEMPREW